MVGACQGGPDRITGPASSLPLPAFAASEYVLQAEPQAPWSLTASDGSGLVMTRVEARAVVQGPLAFTELHVYFHNPENRIREGTFAITLPPNAAVSRFAMEHDQQWMEAEVVEKQLARRAYEDFLHRKQDPALLEKAEGNQFTARVFPIPANGDKHLVLSFSQELPGARYVLPLRGLPKVSRVDIRLATLGADGRTSEQVLAEKDWQPDRDFVSTAGVADVVAAGSLVAAQVPVVAAGAQTADAPRALTMLVDTSASRSVGFGAQLDGIDKLIAALRKNHGDDVKLQVVAFDQETQPIFSGRVAGWAAAHRKALITRGPAGASDLGQAIAWLGTHAPHARLVLVGDGVLTAGAKPEQVVVALKALAGVERVDVVLAGGIRDEQLATQLVRTKERPGAVLDLDAGVAGVASGLAERMLVDVAIEVPGASWVYPRRIASVRPSEHVMVYARFGKPTATFSALVNGVQVGQRHVLAKVGATPALVGRAFAAVEIAELEARLASATGDAASKLRAEIAKRSVAARVVSSQTSMLVLESDGDYARFGIDRKALADILEVAPDGKIVQRHRKGPVIAVTEPEIAVSKDDSSKRKKRPSSERDEGRRLDGPADGQAIETKPMEAEKAASTAPADIEEEREPMAKPEAREAPMPAASAPPPPPPPPPPGRRRLQVDGRPQSQPVADRASSDESDDGDANIAGTSRPMSASEPAPRESWPPSNKPAPLTGALAEIMRGLKQQDHDGAFLKARAWYLKEPGNVLALIGLGEVLEARRDFGSAARAYGSIIDLFPGRADLRRFAGERLERIGQGARGLAIDSYRRAVADRPDHLTGHRLLAYALLRGGKPADAFAAILAGLDRDYPDNRFAGGKRILADDAGMIGVAYVAAHPERRAEVATALGKRSIAPSTTPSTRFILYWETDANDVDFHIQDARGGHAWYSSMQLPSGGELYADVTTGYGPECFAIPGVAKAGPYRLSLDYYSQGPMGYGMGLLQIVRHDGKGKLAFEDRPFVIMADHAFVDLGSFN
ncbi:MAG: VIT domain-containing protein [Kofleriaceae bacterium]